MQRVVHLHAHAAVKKVADLVHALHGADRPVLRQPDLVGVRGVLLEAPQRVVGRPAGRLRLHQQLRRPVPRRLELRHRPPELHPLADVAAGHLQYPLHHPAQLDQRERGHQRVAALVRLLRRGASGQDQRAVEPGVLEVHVRVGWPVQQPHPFPPRSRQRDHPEGGLAVDRQRRQHRRRDIGEGH